MWEKKMSDFRANEGKRKLNSGKALLITNYTRWTQIHQKKKSGNNLSAKWGHISMCNFFLKINVHIKKTIENMCM